MFIFSLWANQLLYKIIWAKDKAQAFLVLFSSPTRPWELDPCFLGSRNTPRTEKYSVFLLHLWIPSSMKILASSFQTAMFISSLFDILRILSKTFLPYLIIFIKGICPNTYAVKNINFKKLSWRRNRFSKYELKP